MAHSSDPQVTAVCIVHEVRPDPGGSVGRTAIDKRPTDQPVAVTRDGLSGDLRCDVPNHGSPRQAVYAYANEDAAWWENELGLTLTPGQFGENLRVSGIDLGTATSGQRWRIGPDLVLEVTKPRIPCRTFQTWMNQAQWVKRFAAAERPGLYLEVVTPGAVQIGDRITIESPGEQGESMVQLFRAHYAR